MVRSLIALALLSLSIPAQARTHIYARVYCVGLYCAIVTEPIKPRRPLTGDWRFK